MFLFLSGLSPSRPACVGGSPRSLLAVGSEASPPHPPPSSPPLTLANAPRAARHRQSHLVFSSQASFSFLYIQLCVERTVCNRQYRPVKYLKWRISDNLTSALLITGADSNKTEGKGVSGLSVSRADCCRPRGLLPSGRSSEPIQS